MSQPAERSPKPVRPDPLFKQITQHEAIQLGLQLDSSELPIKQIFRIA